MNEEQYNTKAEQQAHADLVQQQLRRTKQEKSLKL